MGTLYVVGTPIGNLADLSARAAETLRSVDACYAEDTRRTGKLLARSDIRTALRSLHEHNERARVEEVLERLSRGDSLALVSDAGTPTVSDPGQRLLRAAIAAGHRVSPVPGPSAVVAALSVSGLPADRFRFAGFPPRKGEAREEWFDEVAGSSDTVVVFEAPGRLVAFLQALIDRGLGERRATVCRELTKLHEEVEAGTITELATVYGSRSVKGEVTVVIGADPTQGTEADPAEVEAVVRALASEGLSRRDIAERLTRRFGLSRNEAYRASLSTAEGDPDE